MKRAAVILCMAVLALACSGYREAGRRLDDAEGIMTSSPDSALAVLQAMEDDRLSAKELRARHALLLTMAQDKCYQDVSEDTCIRIAYDWYRHHGPDRYRLLSTYYLGVVKQNAGEYIDAALAFRDAEPLAEGLGDDRQLSLIEQHLSRIYALNYDHVRALEYAGKALDAAERAGEDLMADWCRLDKAEILVSEYRYDEAESILRTILQSARTNPNLYSHVARILAEIYLYKDMPDFVSSQQLYEEILSLKAISLNNHDYGIISLIYEYNGDSVEADRLLSLARSQLQSPLDSVVYFNDCRNVFDLRKDWEKAHNAKSESVKIQDRLIIEKLGQSVSHALEIYYEDKWEKVQIQSRSRLYLVGLIGTLLVTLIIILYTTIRKQKRMLLEDMIKIQEVCDDMDQLQANHLATSRLVDKFIADKVRSLQQLSESFFSWEDAAVKRREEKKGKLMKEEMITSFRRQLGELRDDKTLIPALEQSLNLSEDGLMEKARRLLNREKELDYTILTLLFSGFSIKSVSYLLRMSEPSLRMRKTRFKQQFESLPEPERRLFLERLD